MAGVVVDSFLMPGIELSRVKGVVLGEKDLRGGNDDSDDRVVCGKKGPDGD